MLINANDAEYGMKSTTYTTNGVDGYVTLPTDFSQFRGIDYLIGTRKLTCEPFTFKERNKQYTYTYYSAFPYLTPYQYRIQDTKCELIPLPTAGQSFTIWYIPTPTILTNDTDNLNCNTGWDDWVVYSTAIQCHDKEESDTQVLMAERNRVEQMIITECRRRDQANPYCVYMGGLHE
jgi:hypothetical protein